MNRKRRSRHRAPPVRSEEGREDAPPGLLAEGAWQASGTPPRSCGTAPVSRIFRLCGGSRGSVTFCVTPSSARSKKAMIRRRASRQPPESGQSEGIVGSRSTWRTRICARICSGMQRDSLRWGNASDPRRFRHRCDPALLARRQHGLTLRPPLHPAQEVPGRDLLAPDQDDRNDVHPEQPGPAPQPHAANHSCRPGSGLGQQAAVADLAEDASRGLSRRRAGSRYRRCVSVNRTHDLPGSACQAKPRFLCGRQLLSRRWSTVQVKRVGAALAT